MFDWLKTLLGPPGPDPRVAPEAPAPTGVMGPVEIALRTRRALPLPPGEPGPADLEAQLQAEAMALGFVFDEDAVRALIGAPKARAEVFAVLQRLVGADKRWEPMYPNFPAQVFEASEAELYLNAIRHYWSWGQWRPDYAKQARLPQFESGMTFKPVGRIEPEALLDVFAKLLAANGALAEVDRAVLGSLFHHFDEATLLPHVPASVPFKETLCLMVAHALERGMPTLAAGVVQTTTDVLRVASGLSGGDVSLAENTRFRLSRAQRRWLVATLEPVVSEVDLARHHKTWKRLFHHLHVGTFAHAPRTRALADTLRNGKLQRANTALEAALAAQDAAQALALVARRPGELARRLDHLLRTSDPAQQAAVLEAFAQQVGRVDTRVLVQALGHFETRVGLGARTVFTKAAAARPALLSAPPAPLAAEVVQRVQHLLRETLLSRFAKLPPLGPVWIDPALARCPVPLQMRAASEGLEVLQRGTHVPLGPQRTLRFFIHWVGVDLDLSAAFLTADLRYHSEIAYYALKADGADAPYRAAHSGDITEAPPPDGACEFIDIDLESIQDPDVRYVVMDVRVFAGPPFPFQSANAGWMMRDGLGQRNEVFDARTVKQRIALSAHSRSCMVALFDVRDRQVIWLDLVGSSNSLRGGTNAASNRRNIRDVADAILHSRLLSLHTLLDLHRQARGSVAETREHAETCFDHALVYDYARVLRDFMA